MKTFKIILSDGKELTFQGDRLVNDGLGIHVASDDGTIATFAHGAVQAAYEDQVAAEE